VTARQELQCCYEYAFHPPSLNRLWRQIKQQEIGIEEVKPLLDKAMMLHLALPESGFASQRALQRLALYQAKSRAFGMPTFLRNIRKALGFGELDANTVPGALVRDIGLPAFTHAPHHSQTGPVRVRPPPVGEG
jgi:hypothetical protein